MSLSDDSDAPELSALLARTPAAARRGGVYILLSALVLGLLWAGFAEVERSAAGRYAIEPTAVRAAFAQRAGALSAVYRAAGETVRAGEAIAEIDSPAGRAALRAPIDGVVLRAPAGSLGRPVRRGEPLAAVGALEDGRRAVLFLGGRQATAVRIGAPVAFEGQPDWRGRIARLSPPAANGAVQAEAAVEGAAPLGAQGAARVLIGRRSLLAAAFGAPD